MSRGVHRRAAHNHAFHNRTLQGGTQVKHSHSRFVALAVAFVTAVVLALPVTALAGEAGQFTASAPQSVSYNGQEHHFKSTVKDKNGKELVEGKISSAGTSTPIAANGIPRARPSGRIPTME